MNPLYRYVCPGDYTALARQLEVYKRRQAELSKQRRAAARRSSKTGAERTREEMRQQAAAAAAEAAAGSQAALLLDYLPGDDPGDKPGQHNSAAAERSNRTKPRNPTVAESDDGVDDRTDSDGQQQHKRSSAAGQCKPAAGNPWDFYADDEDDDFQPSGKRRSADRGQPQTKRSKQQQQPAEEQQQQQTHQQRRRQQQFQEQLHPDQDDDPVLGPEDLQQQEQVGHRVRLTVVGSCLGCGPTAQQGMQWCVCECHLVSHFQAAWCHAHMCAGNSMVAVTSVWVGV